MTTGFEFKGVRQDRSLSRRVKFAVVQSSQLNLPPNPAMISSAYPRKVQDTSLAWGQVIFISSDGQYISSRVECERVNSDVLEWNGPFSIGNASGNRSQNEELDAIHPAQAMDAVRSDDV